MSQQATTGVPLLLLDTEVPPANAVTLLRSVVGLLRSVKSGSDIIASLDLIFGDDLRDPRRRLAFHRRGPAALRRIGDHLRTKEVTGTILIDDGGDGGLIRLVNGRLDDAERGALRGAQAIKALLSSDAQEPWGVTLDVRAADDAQPSAPAAAPATAGAGPLDGVVGELLVEQTRPQGLPQLARRDDVTVPLRVLLVDDDPALMLMYQRTFRHAGHDVEVAHDGGAGISAAHARPPDIIVSDIAMPNKTGWDLLAAVRGDPRLAEVPVVLLSCHGDFLHGLARASAGANDYIEKGLRAAALVQRVETAATSRRALKSWGDTPPPSFQARLANVGLFALSEALQRSGASGEVRLDDGWTFVRLMFVAGLLTSARSQEADGTVRDGDLALAAALERGEADVEFIAPGHESEARPPSRRLVALGPSGRGESPVEALTRAALIVEEQRQGRRDRALGGDAAMVFKDAAAALYFLVADEGSARIAQQLKDGATPRQLLEGGADPLVVESIVTDLLRKGVADLLA